MEKTFTIFVRAMGDHGCAATVLGHPELTAVGATTATARSDLAAALAGLLVHDERGLREAQLHFPGIRVRRLDMVLRAIQHGRMLDVPMRFSLLHHPARPNDDDDDETRHHGVLVHVPRLGVSEPLADLADLVPYAEERIRNLLHLAPLERLLQAAWTGEEGVETLDVLYKPRLPRQRNGSVTAGRGGTVRNRVPRALAEACRRLNDEVAAGTLDRVYGLDGTLSQLVEAVHGTRNGILLVGANGCGKTALVHELAHRAEDKEHKLHGTQVYSTSGARIVAGMHYLGQWQQRAQGMVEELRRQKAALHVESLAELLGTRAGSGLTVAQIFEEPLAAGEITMLLEATAEDLARAQRSHPALVSLLQPVVVPGLEPLEMRKALAAMVQRDGKRRNVTATEEAQRAALYLGERMGTATNALGVAARVMRGALARAPEKSAVSRSDVMETFSQQAGLPRALIDPAIRLSPDDVLTALGRRVVGQGHALGLMRDMVVTLKTGLADPGRPLGSFLLLGPTGVGKTESALSLTAYLFGDEKRLIRMDMSEYAAPGSGIRLVDGPLGEGLLTSKVRAQPFGVVLLDEVEKADGSVHDLLLQLLGEGRLTDATGRTVSFRNTVVILTSNLGADRVGKELGFRKEDDADLTRHYRAAAATFFRPELLNRIDHVIAYRSLDFRAIEEIARRLLDAALRREGLLRRGVTVSLGERVIAWLAQAGFHPRYGARPMKRAIEQHVVAPLALVLSEGGAGRLAVEIDVGGEGLVLKARVRP